MLDLDASRAAVEAFDPEAIPSYAKAKKDILRLLDSCPAPASRSSFDPGHLTASGIVLDAEREHVLLVHHKRLERWLQPGGHIEASDTSLLAASRREVLEETGADLDPSFVPELIGMDVHEIPAARGEPAHLHHDVLFVFSTLSRRHRISEESNALCWAPVAKIEDYDPDPPLARTLRRALEFSR